MSIVGFSRRLMVPNVMFKFGRMFIVLFIWITKPASCVNLGEAGSDSKVEDDDSAAGMEDMAEVGIGGENGEISNKEFVEDVSGSSDYGVKECVNPLLVRNGNVGLGLIEVVGSFHNDKDSSPNAMVGLPVESFDMESMWGR
ncbi:hypothetical protein RHMOL_Rhmol01G0061800 [Rhododendron molle]|uniref:Uncharacterized protein n=1 Tax=Rhododendron molle TaxID=49168 RepID=A0ACC0Q0G2_RHOML|nr:hypothetical protein RHMOL_Rhmol01G0061800 [Rhododendron molle]